MVHINNSNNGKSNVINDVIRLTILMILISIVFLDLPICLLSSISEDNV